MNARRGAGRLAAVCTAALVSLPLVLSSARALDTDTEGSAQGKAVLAAVGGYRGNDARTWYLAMTSTKAAHSYPGLGYHKLPHEADRTILEAQKPQLVREVHVWSLHFVKHGDFVWLTAHGQGTDLKLFGRTCFSSSDLAQSRCSWIVLAACSIVQADGGSEPEEEGPGDLTGMGVHWLTSSSRLHGVLGYNTGATWFGGSQRENVFVAEAFAGKLAAGVPVARAWMDANMDAANEFHERDQGGKFGSTSASAVIWEAYEQETLQALNRTKGAPESGSAVYMFLRRDERETRNPWKIAALRGQARRGSSVGKLPSIREYVVRQVSDDASTPGVRIRVDVNGLTDPDMVSLNCQGSLEDLERHGIQVQEGLRLQVYDDGLEGQKASGNLIAEGVVEKHKRHGWVLRIDSKETRHESDPGQQMRQEK